LRLRLEVQCAYSFRVAREVRLSSKGKGCASREQVGTVSFITVFAEAGWPGKAG
jgi:hypothetical protein